LNQRWRSRCGVCFRPQPRLPLVWSGRRV
jgi:hypothetical protein